jgi:mono/diheme cytochrome c family protein
MQFGPGAGAPGGIGRARAYRAGSRISSDMRCKPAYFSGNTGVIDAEADHGSMSTADISNNARGNLMFGILCYSFAIVASLCAVALGGERAFGQVLQGEAAYCSWHDDRPGLRRLLTLQDLPPIEKPTYGLAQVVPIPTGAGPQVQDGFSVDLVTSALRKPRVIREAPNGDLFVADAMFNAVHVLRIPPGGAKPARDEVFASGLKQPFGIAFYPLGSDPRWVYIANSDGVVRFRYRNGQLKATGKPERIVAGIPTTHHHARDIAFSADGRRLFLDPDGTHMQIVATGLRNCEGMTVQSATRDGSLISTEDGNGTIWRVTYRGGPGTASGAGESVQAVFDAAKGSDLYIANCSACHLANGEGIPGAFPPLKGSGVVNKVDAVKHIQVVLNGMQGARAGGVVYASAMPPFAGVLSDAEIAEIIDYERRSWGNHGIPVNAAQVAAERARAK